MVSGLPITRSITIKSTSSAIKMVCSNILSELKLSNFGKDDIFAVHLALDEALVNSVKHGNKMNPEKQIKIDYVMSPDKVELFITDEGEGFDPNSVPDPRCGKNLYRPEGRGLLLIRSYMDLVEFKGKSNRLHMVRYKKQAHVDA